jgi:Ulp1 family protease
MNHIAPARFRYLQHIFNTKLIEEGIEYVARWNENWKLDIFIKKIIMLPINMQSHWSLHVIINVYNLSNYVLGMKVELHPEISFMMLLDSLGLHDTKSVKANIWNWL